MATLFRDLSRLKNQLLISGLQQKDQPLFQVINQLIDQIQLLTNNVFNPTVTSGGTGVTGPRGPRGFAGPSGDAGEEGETRVIMITSGNGVTPPSSTDDYVVLSDGVLPTPAPVDDGFGNFIYIIYTP